MLYPTFNLNPQGQKKEHSADIDNQRGAGDAADDDCSLTTYQRRMIAEGRDAELNLGPYRIQDELGRGNFGQVFKAEHSIMKRIVALKVMTPERAADQHWLLREVRAATRLIHPNIVQAYDANLVDDVLYYAMEYVDGLNLEELVADRGPLPVPFVCAVMRQAALAFQCAYEKGIVHRDIKPANLLIVRATACRLLDGMGDSSHAAAELVKVVDFGLARVYPKGEPNSSTLDKENCLVGTPAFIAPEQARNVHDADIRSDLYSLGCTIYFALTGRPPFMGSQIWEFVAQHREKQAEPLEQVRSDVPAAVSGIIRQLMAKKPEHRFQTPTELLEALAYAQMPCAPCNSPEVYLPKENATAESLVVKEMPADIPQRQDPPLPDTLPQAWREWCNVIESLAHGLACRLAAHEYTTLHKSLLRAIRAQADQQTLLKNDALARLESLVEPWLSLKIIRDLDDRTRLDLWQSCQQINEELFPTRASSGIWLPVLALTGLSLISFLVFLLVRFSPG